MGALTAVVVAWISVRPARAWGRQAHEMINAAAIGSLPEPLRAWFQSNHFYLVAHAADPDAFAAGHRDLQRHHFTDADAYDSLPFRALYQQFVVLNKPPTPVEIRNGDVLWQIDGTAARLAAYWRERRWNAASRDAIFAAHYAADLTQPLHTVSNFDGQLTGQNGIHARFETELVRLRADRWRLQIAPAAYVPNPRQRIFSEFLRSYRASAIIFSADRAARACWNYSQPQFLPAFAQRAAPEAELQIEDAASFVGSVWYTAWVNAGRPNLSSWKAGAASLDR